MVITIDGPAGAGKSTIAKRLAARLGYRFLDTGAMYRAVALRVVRENADWSDPVELESIAMTMHLVMEDENVILDGDDVSNEIRTPGVTRHVGKVADEPSVRRELVRRQRDIVSGGDVVTEGRDQGTAAFPDAEIKFFLTASASERAERRHRQLKDQGLDVDFAELLAEQNARDERDSNRPVGPLIRPENAVEICSDGLTIDEVVDKMVACVESYAAQ